MPVDTGSERGSRGGGKRRGSSRRGGLRQPHQDPRYGGKDFRAGRNTVRETLRYFPGGPAAQSYYGGGGSSGGGGYQTASGRGGGGGGGGYSYGGGGGGSSWREQYEAQLAAERAEAERRKKLVEAYFATAVSNATRQRDAAVPELNRLRVQTRQNLAGVARQNRGVTGDYTRQIQGLQRNTISGLQGQNNNLLRDLQAQGANVGSLQLANSMAVNDARATGNAQDQFNRRLASVMNTGYADQDAMAFAINQGAKSNLNQGYQDQLNQLRAAKQQQLMSLGV